MKKTDDLPELTELAQHEIDRIKEGFVFATEHQRHDLHRALLVAMNPEHRTDNSTLVSFRTTITDKSLLKRFADEANTSVSTLVRNTIHTAIPHFYNK